MEGLVVSHFLNSDSYFELGLEVGVNLGDVITRSEFQVAEKEQAAVRA